MAKLIQSVFLVFTQGHLAVYQLNQALAQRLT
jgi:hypothetical protein